MADNSGVSQTNLELLLEFEGDLQDASTNDRDQESKAGAVTYVSDGQVERAGKFVWQHQNYIDTGVQSLGDADLFCTTGQPFTVAVWVRFARQVSSGTGTIIARQQGTGFASAASSVFFMHVTTDKRLLIRLRGQDNYYSINLHDGDWHHLAITWNGSVAKFYFDGTIQTAPTVGSAPESPFNIFIGASDLQDNADLSSNLTGHMDEMRVYSRALSAAEITELNGYTSDDFTPVAGELELYLKFEEDLLDSSGNDRHQTGNESDDLLFVPGRIEEFAVTGVNAGATTIDTGESSLGGFDFFADSGNAWTVAFWEFGGSSDLVRLERGSENRINTAGSGTDVSVELRDTITPFTDAITVDAWNHIALTWDGTTAKVYANGEELGEAGVGAASDPGVGATITIRTSDDGVLDDVRLYSKALSLNEVQTLANADSPITTTLSIDGAAGETTSIDVVFSRGMTGFVAGDVTVVNGSISNFTGSGTTWSFDVTADGDGAVEVSIAAGAVESDDGDGLTNAVSNTLAWLVGEGASLFRFDRSEAPTHSASVLIGPVKLSEDARFKTLIQDVRVVLGSDTDATGNFLVSGGIDGEDSVTRAEDDGHQYSATIAALQNNSGVVRPRVAGSAVIFQFDITSGHCVFEGMTVGAKRAGKNRGVKYS